MISHLLEDDKARARGRLIAHRSVFALPINPGRAAINPGREEPGGNWEQKLPSASARPGMDGDIFSWVQSREIHSGWDFWEGKMDIRGQGCPSLQGEQIEAINPH